MNVFLISCPLVLSCILRFLAEDSMVHLLAENLLAIVLFQWMVGFKTTFVFALAAFLGLAFYQTRVEYTNITENVREIGHHTSRDRLVPSCPLSNPGISDSLDSAQNSSPLMCPINVFEARRFKKTTHSTVPQNALERSLTIASGVSRHYEEPGGLHGKPVLFPCDLRHRRIAPFKDYFSHSYLYVGTPVGLRACYSPLLAVDLPRETNGRWLFKKAWFSLRAKDHAIRGGAHLSLTQKLTEYLISEGANPNEWAYAYLLAVPSTNGQVDNPLGFWYLYSADRELTAIIPELNTSYGERRMWLVRQALPPKSDSEKPRNSPYAFRGHFGKDIHVSPFMPSTGSYTIDTCDPCASSTNQLDILVTLTKPEGGPLLVTRVSSSSPGLDASAASMRQKLSFLVRWCYVPTCTVMTFRILSEAARIYLKAPRYWSRPEPLKSALGKPARAIEMTLERSFRLILKAAVDRHVSPLHVIYKTPGEHSHKSEVFLSRSALEFKTAAPAAAGTITPPASDSDDEDTLKVTIQVISPIFYSRFFHYRVPEAAITSELLDDARTRTLWSSDPELLASIFSLAHIEGSTSVDEIKYPERSNRWHWWLLSLLRAAPIATNYDRSTPYKPFKGPSAMDLWVLQNLSVQQVREYRRALLRVFLGEWIGGTLGPLKRFSDDMEPFGMSRDAVVRTYDAAFKAAIVAATVWAMRDLEIECENWSVGVVEWMTAGINIWAFWKAIV